jgi:hypothetical protein
MGSSRAPKVYAPHAPSREIRVKVQGDNAEPYRRARSGPHVPRGSAGIGTASHANCCLVGTMFCANEAIDCCHPTLMLATTASGTGTIPSGER